MTVRAWLLWIMVVLLIMAFLGYARGPDHHHGDDVGALRVTAASLG